MKTKKRAVQDLLLALLMALFITLIDYFFLITINYLIAFYVFCMFFCLSILFTTSLRNYREKRISRKLSTYYIATSILSIIAAEAPLVAIMHIEKDAIKTGSLFITLISWSILSILIITCRPQEEENKQ